MNGNASDHPAPSPTGRLAWFEWYPSDFLGEVRGWPLVARAVYRELLDAQWDMGQLPCDPTKLRVLVPGITHRQWQVAWGLVEQKFPVVGEGRQNAALESKRRRAHELRERRQKAGRQGAEGKWRPRDNEAQNDSPPDDNAMRLPSESDGKANGLHLHHHRHKEPEKLASRRRSSREGR
jgi:hypothetical protein